MKSKTATQPVNHRSAWHTLLGMVVVLSIAHALSAQAVITVTSFDDSGPGSLRQAIADAPPGDTIDFAITGTIMLTSGELVITNDLIISGPGPTNLTVSGNYATRVFEANAGIVRMSGLTIAKGNLRGDGNHGAGIHNTTSLTISNCTITDNWVADRVLRSGGQR